MEELTFQENLLINNSREHLKVMSGNLRIASEELSNVLRELIEGRKTLKYIVELKEQITVENVQIVSTQDERSAAQDRRESFLLLRENKQLEVDKAFQKKTLESIGELEDINRQTILAKSQHGKLIDSQEEEIKIFEDKIINLKTEILNNEETIKEQSGVKKEQENEILGLTSQIEEAKKGLIKFISQSQEFMVETNKTIDEEKSKIQNPLELIKREQEKLERLKTDLAILKVRLTQQFKSQNPESNIPLELQ